jgi:hypothetical protein
MSDGTRGEVPKTGSSLTDLKLSNPESVAKISIYYKDGKDYPFGYKFYSKAGGYPNFLALGTILKKTFYCRFFLSYNIYLK